MPFDSEVALFGTGLAPLIAASHFLGQGKSVVLLNPDHDFFLEDSELPLDPFLPSEGAGALNAHRVARNLPEGTLETLRPYFPGAVEFWSAEGGQHAGFHDPDAPHVRSRARLWMPFAGALEDFYVEAADRGLYPQILDGPQATSRFPGVAHPRKDSRGLLLPRICDVDVSRYRNGVLEFVRERAGAARVVCDATQVELMPGGVRFHAEGISRTARISEGALVFWTPRMSAWIIVHARRMETSPRSMSLPVAVRLWEQWKIVSRDPLDPGVVGTFGGALTVWAECEGIPNSSESGLTLLCVLRAGPRLKLEESLSARGGASWASAESFDSLSGLFHEFLKWDRFSVRSMTPRAILEWDRAGSFSLPSGPDRVQVVRGCDGPLINVVQNARAACEELEAMSAAR